MVHSRVQVYRLAAVSLKYLEVQPGRSGRQERITQVGHAPGPPAAPGRAASGRAAEGCQRQLAAQAGTGGALQPVPVTES